MAAKYSLPLLAKYSKMRFARAYASVAARPALAMALCGILPLLPLSAQFAAKGPPIPRYHDEFSYLLAAETFAQGRCTNPPHPLWRSFFTFHVIQQPTYMSSYPPAQGLFLATGELLVGHAYWGVILTNALMCTVMCWMFYAWLSPRWAFTAGLLAAAQLSLFTYWSQTYNSGAVVALGGALLFGSVRRVVRSCRSRDGVLMGLGVNLLAISRPFEGLIVSLLAAVLLLRWFFLDKQTRPSHRLLKVMGPLCLVILLGGWGQGAYNRQVTGDATLFPRNVFMKEFSEMPLFIWHDIGRTRNDHVNAMIAQFDREFNLKHYFSKRESMRSWIVLGFKDLTRMLTFYFSWVLAVPVVLLLPLTLSSRRMRFAAVGVVAVAFLDAFGITILNQPHYIAPVACLLFLLTVQSLHWLNLLTVRHYRVGGLLLAIVAAGFVSTAGWKTLKAFARRDWADSGRSYVWHVYRHNLQKRLSAEGGRDLVMVRYGSGHVCHAEWVWNAADIDQAAVVWAHEMDTEQNGRLMKYFGDRTVWLLTVESDLEAPRLELFRVPGTANINQSERFLCVKRIAKPPS